MQAILVQFAKSIRKDSLSETVIKILPHFLYIQGINNFIPQIESHGLNSPCPELTAINLPKYRILLLLIQNFFHILHCREICFLNIEMIHEAKGIISRTDSFLNLFPRQTSSDTQTPASPLSHLSTTPRPLLSNSFKQVTARVRVQVCLLKRNTQHRFPTWPRSQSVPWVLIYSLRKQDPHHIYSHAQAYVVY